MSLPLKRCLTGNKFLKYTSFQVSGICNQFHRIPDELFKIWANCDYIGTEKSKSEKLKFTVMTLSKWILVLKMRTKSDRQIHVKMHRKWKWKKKNQHYIASHIYIAAKQ